VVQVQVANPVPLAVVQASLGAGHTGTIQVVQLPPLPLAEAHVVQTLDKARRQQGAALGVVGGEVAQAAQGEIQTSQTEESCPVAA